MKSRKNVMISKKGLVNLKTSMIFIIQKIVSWLLYFVLKQYIEESNQLSMNMMDF